MEIFVSYCFLYDILILCIDFGAFITFVYYNFLFLFLFQPKYEKLKESSNQRVLE